MTVYVTAFRSAAGMVPVFAEVPVDPVVSARSSSRVAASGASASVSAVADEADDQQPDQHHPKGGAYPGDAVGGHGQAAVRSAGESLLR